MPFFGQKWRLKAVSAKSEENGLCLKFDFTSSRGSQNFLGGLLVPYLEFGPSTHPTLDGRKTKIFFHNFFEISIISSQDMGEKVPQKKIQIFSFLTHFSAVLNL